MKFKATRKDFQNQRVIGVSYCGLQYLFNYENPIAYNAGVYGWNWDIYQVENTYICTGYRNIIGIRPNYEVVKKYEDEARKIVNSKPSYEDIYYYFNKKEALKKLQREFIKEVIKEIDVDMY